MKTLSFFLTLIALFFFSCTSERILFEKETWWNGHWQNVNDTTNYFSSGQKKVGVGEIVTPQFFISRNDSILENFYVEELLEFNHKKKYKLIETNAKIYLKIQEIEADHLEVYGPVSSINELDSVVNEYIIIPENIDPPIPDSILYDL